MSLDSLIIIPQEAHGVKVFKGLERGLIR